MKSLEENSGILKHEHLDEGEELASRANPEPKSSLFFSPRHTTPGNCASAATLDYPSHREVLSEKYSCKTFVMLLQALTPGLLQALFGSEGRVVVPPPPPPPPKCHTAKAFLRVTPGHARP